MVKRDLLVDRHSYPHLRSQALGSDQKVELLLLRIKSQMRWLGDLVGMPPGHLRFSGDVSLVGGPRKDAKDAGGNISLRQVWECLRTPVTAV